MSFLGFLGKAIVGGVTGLVTGGPLGAVTGVAAAALGGRPQAGSAGGGVAPASPIRVTQPFIGAPLRYGQPLGLSSQIGRTLMAGAGGSSMPGTGQTSLP